MLGDVFDAEQCLPMVAVVDPDEPAPPKPFYFEIPAEEQNAVFLVRWDDANDDLRVGWRPQSAPDTDPFVLIDPTDAAIARYWRRSGHAVLAVNLPAATGAAPAPATVWRLQHMDGAVAQPLNSENVLCMRDLVTKSEIDFDKHQYFTGEPIGLSCVIRSHGQPVTGAPVEVEVAKPGEGLGTFETTAAFG